jgi:hypothetical protein
MLFPIFTIRAAKRFTDTSITVADKRIAAIDRKIDRLDAKRAQYSEYKAWAFEASTAYSEFLSALDDAEMSHALNVGQAAERLALTLPEPPKFKVVTFGRRHLVSVSAA